MWEGVTVLGDETKSPTAANQGLVSLINDGRIENAYVGTHAGSTYYNSSGRHTSTGVGGGGLVQSLQPVNSQGAHFLNCRRSAWFAPYNFSGTGFSNPSVRFENTNFIATQSNYLNDVNLIDANGQPAGPAFMLGSWDRDYIRVQKCRFESTPNFPIRERGIGIDLADARMTVIDCDFNHLQEGSIARYFNDASEPFKMRLSRFNDVKRGITISEGMGHAVETCHFFNLPVGSSSSLDASYGIQFLGTNGATVNKTNHFEGTGVHDYGIISTETEAMPTLVQDNLFNNLRSGIQTEKDNHGEQIRCNQFAQHYRAWSINPVSPAFTWFSDQGLCGPDANQAGNKFFDDASNCNNQNWRHHIESSIAFEYKYRGGYPSEKPECSSSNVTLDDCSDFGEGINPGACASAPPPCDPCPLTFLEAAIEDEDDPFEKQRLQLQLIDFYAEEGMFEESLSLIESAFPNEKTLLIGAFIEHGQYAEAQNLMASISTIAVENWSDFQAIFFVLIDLGQNEKTVWQLSEQQINQLSMIAQSSSKARFKAQALLELREGTRFPQPIEQWAEDFDGNHAQNRFDEASLEKKGHQAELQIFPNPTNDRIEIRWQLSENETADQLEIFDLNGRTVGKKQLNALHFGVTDWSFEKEPKGIYIVLLRHRSGMTVARISVQ